MSKHTGLTTCDWLVLAIALRGAPSPADGFSQGSYSGAGSYSESSASSFSSSKSSSYNYSGAGTSSGGLGYQGGAGAGSGAYSGAGSAGIAGAGSGAGHGIVTGFGAGSGGSGAYTGAGAAETGAHGADTGFGAAYGAGGAHSTAGIAGVGSSADHGTNAGFGAGSGFGGSAGVGHTAGIGISGGLSHATVPAFGDHISALRPGSSNSGPLVDSYGVSLTDQRATGADSLHSAGGIGIGIGFLGSNGNNHGSVSSGNPGKYNSPGFGGASSGAGAQSGAYGGSSTSLNGGVSSQPSAGPSIGFGIGITSSNGNGNYGSGSVSGLSGSGHKDQPGKIPSPSPSKYIGNSQNPVGYGGSLSSSGAGSGAYGSTLVSMHNSGVPVSSSDYPSGGSVIHYDIGLTAPSASGQPGQYTGPSGFGVDKYGTTGSAGYGVSSSGAGAQSGTGVGQVGFGIGIGMTGTNANTYNSGATIGHSGIDHGKLHTQGTPGYGSLSSGSISGSQSGAYGGSLSNSAQPSGGSVISFEIGTPGQKVNTYGSGPTSNYSPGSQNNQPGKITGSYGGIHSNTGFSSTSSSAANSGAYAGSLGTSNNGGLLISSKPSTGVIGINVGLAGTKGNNYGSGISNTHSISGIHNEPGKYTGSFGGAPGIISSGTPTVVATFGIGGGSSGSSANSNSATGVYSSGNVVPSSGHTHSVGHPGKYTGSFGGAPGILGNQETEGYAIKKKPNNQVSSGSSVYGVTGSSNIISSYPETNQYPTGASGSVGFGISGSAGTSNKLNGQYDGNHGQGHTTNGFGGSIGISGGQQVGYGVKDKPTSQVSTIQVTTGVLGSNKNKYGQYDGDFGGAPGIIVATGPAVNHPGHVGAGVVVSNAYGGAGSHSTGKQQSGLSEGCTVCDNSKSGSGGYNSIGSGSAGAYAGSGAAAGTSSGGYGGTNIHVHGSNTPLGVIGGVIGGVLRGMGGGFEVNSGTGSGAAAGAGAGSVASAHAGAGSYAGSSSNSASLGLGGLFSAGLSSSHASASSSAGSHAGYLG